MASLLPILTFHALENRSSVISFSPQVFRHGMAKLHEDGYRTISLLDALNCLQMKIPFPERSLVITFDDGYQTIYEVAFPTMQDFGISATIFLTVGRGKTGSSGERFPSIEGRSMLNWDEVKEMKRWGIDFGAHTMTHPDLTRLPLDRVQNEVVESKTVLEDALGAPISCFAYPYGRFNHRIRELVQQHFVCACSDKLGLIRATSKLHALERVDAYYHRTDKLFDLITTGLFPWYIRARNIPRSVRHALLTG